MVLTDQQREACRETFDDNSRVTNPGAAGSFQKQLGMVRNLAMFLPLAPAVVPWNKIYYIIGYDDVIAALADDAPFAPPYGAAMKELDTNRKVSLLGFDDSLQGRADYRKNLCQVMRAMPLDMARRMGEFAKAEADRILEQKGDRLDLVKDLLIPITLDVTQKFYGVAFQDPAAFLRWTSSVLNYVFGAPGAPAYKKLAAKAASELMDDEIESNIKKTKNKKKNSTRSEETVLETMIKLEPQDDLIQATMAGLLVGGMPPVPEAGYNIMQVLLSNPQAMKMAREAAASDDERLARCLGEALRFRPVLPVIFRKCAVPPASLRQGAASAQLAGLVDWLGRPIPSGADVGIFGLTANFDPRHVKSPRRFDPTRPLSDNLVFGHGRHWCLGVPIAMAVLVNVFRQILAKGTVTVPRNAPRTRFFLDYFAENFEICIGRDGP